MAHPSPQWLAASVRLLWRRLAALEPKHVPQRLCLDELIVHSFPVRPPGVLPSPLRPPGVFIAESKYELFDDLVQIYDSSTEVFDSEPRPPRRVHFEPDDDIVLRAKHVLRDFVPPGATSLTTVDAAKPFDGVDGNDVQFEYWMYDSDIEILIVAEKKGDYNKFHEQVGQCINHTGKCINLGVHEDSTNRVVFDPVETVPVHSLPIPNAPDDDPIEPVPENNIPPPDDGEEHQPLPDAVLDQIPLEHRAYAIRRIQSAAFHSSVAVYSDALSTLSQAIRAISRRTLVPATFTSMWLRATEMNVSFDEVLSFTKG